MKHQIQEPNRIEERLEKSLKEKNLIYERMEEELVHLREELDAEFIQTRYENSSKILEKIVTTQRDPSNKNGIGYSKEENQVISKSYAVSLLSTFKNREEEKTSNDQNSRRSFPPIKKGIQDNSKEGLSKHVSSHFSLVISLHALSLDTKLLIVEHMKGKG